MRQRYLLGIYNYETYIKPLIEKEKKKNGDEFDMLSPREGMFDV